MPYPPVPPAKKKSALPIILAIVGGIILLCCGGGAIIAAVNSGKSQSATSANSSPETPSNGTKAAKAAPGLNSPVRDGKFEFLVSSIECGKPQVGNEVLNRKAQGQFCVITISVKNIGSRAQTFFVDNQKGYAANGTQYSPDSVATIYASGDQSTWVNAINPGNSISGPIVFDLPAGATLASLKLHDSAFSGGVEVKVG